MYSASFPGACPPMKTLPHFGPYTLGEEVRRTSVTRTLRAARLEGGPVLLTCLTSGLHARAVENDERDTFERAVRVLRDLRHPGIAPIVDSGVSPTVGSFVAIEEPHEKRLDAWLAEQKRVDEHTVHALALHAAAAVGALGEVGLVHGHLQPSSFVVRGQGVESSLLLCELPIVTATLGKREERALGELYLAPEHVAGEGIDERTDVHSLGLVFLELLVGTERFESIRGAMLMAGRPFAAEDSLSSAWNRLLARALGRDPRTRHETVQELGDELQTLYTRRSSGALRIALGAPSAVGGARAVEPTVTNGPRASAPAQVPTIEASLDLSSPRQEQGQGAPFSPDALDLDFGAAAPSPDPAPPPADTSHAFPDPVVPPAAPAAPPAPPVATPSARQLHLQAATELAGRVAERAVDTGKSLKSNRRGLALGGIVLAVGVVALLFFGIVRIFYDGEPSGPSTKTGKHTSESAGATAAP